VATYALSGLLPRDWEDISRGPGQTLWIGDIGDNSSTRVRGLLVHRMPEPGPRSAKTLTATSFRLRYEDGPRDAEALVVTSDRVLVVEKTFSSSAGVYAAALPLQSGGAVNLLHRVAEVSVPSVTGGDISPDGTRFVLRNYTAAYEWQVRGGDLVTALAGEPTRVALPPSPQGEGIAYSRDGRAVLTSSEGKGAPVFELRRTAAASPSAPPRASPDPVSGASAGWRIPLLAASVTLVGVLVVTRIRRRRRVQESEFRAGRG
jgi:hypothetical protein